MNESSTRVWTPHTDLYDRLEQGGYRPRWTNELRFESCCPGHEDSPRHPSLSGYLKDDGSIALVCFTKRCTTEKILEPLGLEAKYVFPSQRWFGSQRVPELAPPRRVEYGPGHDPEPERPPDVTVAQLAAAKRLPLHFIKRFAVDAPEGGVKIYYYDGPDYAGTKFRKWLSGKKNYVWYGAWGKDGAKRESCVYTGRRTLEEGWRTGRFPTGEIVLVEGETDSWTLWYHGFPALGVQGGATKALRPEHLAGIVTVYVVEEHDNGGGKAFFNGVVDRLFALGYEGAVRHVAMPAEAKDPSDLHVTDPERFRAAFRAMLDAAPLVDLGAEVSRILAAARQNTPVHPPAPGATGGATRIETDGVLEPIIGGTPEQARLATARRETSLRELTGYFDREIARVDNGDRAAAGDFARMVTHWARRQSAPEFWDEVRERPTRLIVAAVERVPEIRMWAAEQHVALPVVERALKLAVIEGPPQQRASAYRVRWQAFEAVERYITRRTLANPSLAEPIKLVGERVKDVMRTQGSASFWNEFRDSDAERLGQQMVDRAGALDPEIASARDRLRAAAAPRGAPTAAQPTRAAMHGEPPPRAYDDRDAPPIEEPPPDWIEQTEPSRPSRAAERTKRPDVGIGM